MQEERNGERRRTGRKQPPNIMHALSRQLAEHVQQASGCGEMDMQGSRSKSRLPSGRFKVLGNSWSVFVRLAALWRPSWAEFALSWAVKGLHWPLAQALLGSLGILEERSGVAFRLSLDAVGRLGVL